MGIYSEKACVKKFMYNERFWAKLQDYDVDDVLKIAETTVKDYYFE